MRSCLIYPYATVAHGGTYVCQFQESMKGQTAYASVNVTVLGEMAAHTHTKVKQTYAVQMIIIITLPWQKETAYFINLCNSSAERCFF